MTDTTKLAKFLGWELKDWDADPGQKYWFKDNSPVICPNSGDSPYIEGDWDLPHIFFIDSVSSSYFAHLAKREMIKQEFIITEQCSEDLAFCTIEKLNDKGEQTVYVQNQPPTNNPFKALWLAIEKTGVLDE